MEKFRIIYPAPLLAPYIKHYWLLESDDIVHSQRIIPTGNIELVFHRGHLLRQQNGFSPRISLCGQTLSFADLQPTGYVNMITVVFHPFGAKAFFDLPFHELSGLAVSVEDLNKKAFTGLEDKILSTPDDALCIRLIETFLLDRLRLCKAYNYKRMAEAVDTINKLEKDLSVPLLAEKICLSKKQFQRIFHEYIGLSPKEFMRVVRFHKALFILQNDPSMNFTRLTYECGYYDQSHLIREFKQFAGYTPREYMAACSPHSDYFSY